MHWLMGKQILCGEYCLIFAAHFIDPVNEASEYILDLASPCTTNESSCFKETINFNKSDSPKLCVEPLQMKRKKRGEGYNLRRSLAWDKAFFTEEGFLDPVELSVSVINGASCNGDGDHGKDGKKDWSSPKIKSSSLSTMTSTSLTSHKFPTHLCNKSASRCGDCPRPLPSPSLKRPANVNVGKAAGKDLKLSKVPICATTMSCILKAKCVKHNQVTKADFNIQKISGSKSFPKSFKNNQSASKGSSVRPARYLDGNSGNSSSKRLSSMNMSPVLDGNADNSGVLDPVEPSVSIINGVSCNGDGDHGNDGKKDWSSPKIKSTSLSTMTSTSLTSRKFPTHLGNKSVSRCGVFPRPARYLDGNSGYSHYEEWGGSKFIS